MFHIYFTEDEAIVRGCPSASEVTLKDRMNLPVQTTTEDNKAREVCIFHGM